MFNKENVKALSFALIVCLICALVLALCADGLKDIQAKNALVDKKKNILKALKITDKAGATPEEVKSFFENITSEQIESVYESKVKSFAVDGEGNKIEKPIKDISEKELAQYLLVYQYVEGSEVKAFAIPVEGKGLWSTLYGFLALEKDLNTVKGITFYKHGETPGLGAEIEQDWFQSNFVGKKILDEKGDLVSISVFKGHVEESTPGANHKVDGISGATMTGNGVTRLLEKDLSAYNKYFSKVRSGSNG